MRVVGVAVSILFVVLPGVGSGQTSKRVEIQAAVGPVLGDAGHHLSASIGFSPSPRVTVLFNVDHSDLYRERREYPDGGYSDAPGGTVTSGGAEVRLGLLPTGRVLPYVAVGIGAGAWRPRVTDEFLYPASHARYVSGGAGVIVPIGAHLRLFSDVRVMVGGAANDVLGVAPVRAGIAWRF